MASGLVLGFIAWHMKFDRFVPEQHSEAIAYGLVHNLGDFNPQRVAFHKGFGIWQDANQSGLTLRQRLAYMVAPPGYSHDGSRETPPTLKENTLPATPKTQALRGSTDWFAQSWAWPLLQIP